MRNYAKGFSNITLIAGLLFVLLALSGINIIKSVADTITPQQQPQTPEQITKGIMGSLSNPVTAPLWLLLLIIVLIMILK